MDNNLIWEAYLTEEGTPPPPPAPAATAVDLYAYQPGTTILYNDVLYTLPPSHNPTQSIPDTENIMVTDPNGTPMYLPYGAANQGLKDGTVTVTPPAAEGTGEQPEEKEVDPEENMSKTGQVATGALDSMAANTGSKDSLTKWGLGKVRGAVRDLTQQAPEYKAFSGKK